MVSPIATRPRLRLAPISSSQTTRPHDRSRNLTRTCTSIACGASDDHTLLQTHPRPPPRWLRRRPRAPAVGRLPPFCHPPRPRPPAPSRQASSGARPLRPTRSKAPSMKTAAALHLGHLLAHPRQDQQGRHRRRRRRPLPSLQEDIALMKRPRPARPTASPSPGRASSPPAPADPTPKGLDFYNRIVDALLAAGIQPYLHPLPLGSPPGPPRQGRLAKPRHLPGLRRLRRRTPPANSPTVSSTS